MLFTHYKRLLVFLVIFAVVVIVLWCGYQAHALYMARTLSLGIIDKTTPYMRGDMQRTQKMLVLGDSAAYGVGAHDPKETTAARVAEALLLNVDNVSLSGAKVGDLRDQLLRAPGNKYDLALVQVGANDIIYFSSLPDVAEVLDLFLPALKSRASRIVWLTSGDVGKAPLWPFPLNYIYSARTSKWREVMLPIFEKHGVEYIDLLVLPDPFLTDVGKYYSADKLHLSGDGYAVWAGYILDVLHEKSINN